MRIERIRKLRGPNRYLSKPVMVALVELEELSGRETVDYLGFTEKILMVVPGLADHHCASGEPGGLLAKMRRGTFFGHVTEHVTLELSHLIDRDVYFGRTLWAGTDGRFYIILECPRDEWPGDPTAEDLLRLAIDTVQETLAGGAPDLTGRLATIRSAYEASRLGVSTAALARAARERDIPVRRLSDVTLLQLGYGRHRRLVWAASTQGTSTIGVDIAADKEVTKQLLAAAGIPVPESVIVRDEESAASALRYLGAPVVVKPVHGHHGEDVFVGLQTREEVLAAFRQAGAGVAAVLVESYVPGRDYRALVVGGRLVAATELVAAHVKGDGASDIATLVARVNDDPRRGEGHDRELTRLTIDAVSIACLSSQGFRPSTVLSRGQTAWLRRNANLSTGGTSRDVTDVVHANISRICTRAAQAVGLDVCGIDLRVTDISEPLIPGTCSGGVIEVNASPGLRMHLSPSEGTPRDVAAAIIEHVYPPGAPTRIPIVSVTGTNGKTTTVRLIAHILQQIHRSVGTCTTEGVFVNGDLVFDADASGPRSAEMVLADPQVEVAVLETARGGLVRHGLGYDGADVGVITNITRDHLGSDGIDTMDDLVAIKSIVAEEIRPGGNLVLNADDPNTAALASRPGVRDRNPVIRLFALSPTNKVVAGHLQRGGIGYVVEGGWLVEAAGSKRVRLAPVRDIPLTLGGQATFNVANALAAAAACRALGVGVEDLRRALTLFQPAEHNPGRVHVLHVGGIPVLVDYAHNPAAMAAIGDLIRRQWSTDPVAVITLPGDRRDDLIEETARAVAQMSDRVVVYEDEDKRGRAPGEMTDLIASALIDARPSLQCIAATGVKHALTTALALAAPSGPILVVYEKLAPVIEMLQQFDTAHAALLRPDSPYLPIQRTERSEQPVPHTRQVPVRSDSTIR